jgi:predicted amidohydrolase YtcJ
LTRLLVAAEAVRTAAGILGDAILIEDGVVVATGDRASLDGEVERRYSGAILMPGLRDAHLHPVGYAAALRETTLGSATNYAEMIRLLRRSAKRTPEPAPVLGMRLNEETLDEHRLPDRMVLDEALPHRPALVHRYCGHVAVANTAALKIADVDGHTPDPPGGSIDRDEHGVPTGVLRETAVDLVAERFPGANEVTSAELLSALQRLAAAGITSVGAMLRTGSGSWASLGNELDITASVADQMPIKIGAYTIDENPDSVRLSKARTGAAGGRLRWLGIKRFGDGSFGGHTAAMSAPFTDVDTSGTLRLSQLDREIADASLATGGGAAIHAIGDRAVAAVLDMFEQLVADGADPGKLRIEHASVATIEDIARMTRLGITAVVQPPFIGSEASWLHNRLGNDRIERTYAFATMDEAGIWLAGSSDCPVEPPDPWTGMALAQDRMGLSPAQALAPDRALALYTSGAAHALREPEPLAVGSPADFIAVDRDPIEVGPSDLRATQVLAIYVDGLEVETDRSLPMWLD